MKDNLQFHIKLEKVDEICLISGNPDRVPVIASHLKDSEKAAEHRGLVAYKGFSPKKTIPVTVLTTGMGCPSTAIVLEEAYLAGARTIIRIGSTGSLQPGTDMGIGTIFIPHAAIRDESTSINYAPMKYPAAASPELHRALCDAAKSMNVPYQTGIVWSTDIYYSSDPNRNEKYSKLGAACIEMESSTLYIFGAVKGRDVKTGTILTSDGNLIDGVNIYRGNVEENLKLFSDRVEKSVQIVMEAIDSFL
ncbi:MAG: nucleoside phosphorylase [Candidatus Hodarchaeales archaeon]|jgi:uridine phosphorylase